MTSPPCFDRPSACFKEKFIAVRWGGNALIALFISLISGVVISLQYNPAEPFYSTSTMELIVPFGSFWRGMHYYSSQAFFLLLLLHFTAVTWENTHYYSRTTWVRLTLSIPVTLLLLFTGYVLRDDATGEAAGLIAENITLSLPLVGSWFNSILFAVSTAGVKRVYANHLVGIVLIGAYCVWPHLRRYSTRWRDNLVLICLVLLVSVMPGAPFEPPQIGMLHIEGPWFFLGLQEALRYIQPLWAGIVFPGIVIFLLLRLPHKGTKRNVYFSGLLIWLGLYTLLSAISLLRI